MAAFRGDPTVVVEDVSEVDCGEPWPAEWADFEQQVFELVNEVRASGTTCGGQPAPAVAPLEQNAVLVCTARLHSKDMGDRGYFEHETPEGTSPFDRMTSAGYEWSGAAENIAKGQRTAEDVMRTWLDSPGHCSNIMGDYVHIGVGYYGDGEDPLWTQNFGSPQR
jgi:uncharacterized protein YkwD